MKTSTGATLRITFYDYKMNSFVLKSGNEHFEKAYDNNVQLVIQWCLIDVSTVFLPLLNTL